MMLSLISSRPAQKLFLICLLTILLIGNVVKAGESSSKCIGVVTAGGGVDFWHKVGEGAIQAGKELHFEVIVRGPKDATTSQMQGKLIDHMLQIGCRALVVAPNSLHSLTLLSELASKGVTTVLVDRDYESDEFLVVKTNNYKAGVKAAEVLLKHLDAGSNVAIFKLSPDVSSTNDREQGFISTINEAGMNLLVNEYLGSKQTPATTTAFEVLSDNPGIDGIFTPNESTTMAVLNTRKRLAIANSTLHIGFDSHPSFISAIEKNELHSIVVQKPYDMGYLAVKELVRIINNNGDALPTDSNQNNQKIETPVLIVDKNNLIH